MARLTEEEKTILECSGLTLGSASLLAIAGGALALCAGTPVQTLQKAMTWMSVPWFGGCCLVCRWGYGRRRRKAAMTAAPDVPR